MVDNDQLHGSSPAARRGRNTALSGRREQAATAAHPDTPPSPAQRDQISGMRSLLALSMVMAESDDQDDILRLAMTSIRGLGRFRSHGAYLGDAGWRQATGAAEADTCDDLEAQFAVLSAAGGAVAVLREVWAWAYPLRSLDNHLGYLVVGAPVEPAPGEQFLLRVLAQQTGIALANARRRALARAGADRLRVTNAALTDTVAALTHGADMHERLSMVAAAGAAPEGIAAALHELTGRPVAVEDRHGNLRAWAGSGRPDHYPKGQRAAREETLREAVRAARPIRRNDRVIMPAGLRGEVLGVLALIDPDGAADRHDLSALEHAATILALRLADLNSLREAEQRLGRELVDELLSGANEEAVLALAEALGYDLRRPHRAVVVAADDTGTDDEEFLQAVRGAAHEVGVGSLLAVRGHDVVVLSDTDLPWHRFLAAIRRRLGRSCRLGVGGAYDRPHDLCHSHHEARLALRLRTACGSRPQIMEFDRLGVYRLLAAIDDQTRVERFVGEWLGALLDYDRRRRSELVTTLSRYLECGRRYDAATAALAIHRSTLKYRIQRIRQISGHDLGDPDTCFNLQLATRAWHVLSLGSAPHHPQRAPRGEAAEPGCRTSGDGGDRRTANGGGGRRSPTPPPRG